MESTTQSRAAKLNLFLDEIGATKLADAAVNANSILVFYQANAGLFIVNKMYNDKAGLIGFNFYLPIRGDKVDECFESVRQYVNS